MADDDSLGGFGLHERREVLEGNTLHILQCDLGNPVDELSVEWDGKRECVMQSGKMGKETDMREGGKMWSVCVMEGRKMGKETDMTEEGKENGECACDRRKNG